MQCMGEIGPLDFFNSSIVPSFVSDTESAHAHWLNVEVPLCGGKLDLNFCEIIPIVHAIQRWGSAWCNKQLLSIISQTQVLCLTDNTQVVQMINKGISASENCMWCIRRLFWLAVRYNCHLVACYIPGTTNVMPDKLSRVWFKSDTFVLSNMSLCCSKLTSVR